MRSVRSLFSLPLLVAALTVSAVTVGASSHIEKRSFRPCSFVSTATESNDLPLPIAVEPVLERKRKALSVRGGVANTMQNAVLGTIVMALIEKGVGEAFKAADIKFPPMLGGCIFLFAFLLVSEAVVPKLANDIFEALSPAATLLAKWLPMLFVPGLVILPLAPPIGDATEILKVLVVVALGFVYTLATTTLSVAAVRTAQGTMTTSALSTKAAATSTPAAKPFRRQTLNAALIGTVITGMISIFATRSEHAYATPLQTIFLCFATVASYVWGANLPAGFVKLVHPLVTSSVVLLVLIRALAKVTDVPFLDVVKSYRTGSLDPMKTGAGDIWLYLLGPSVISFAISMYSRRELLRSNLLVVFTAMIVSSAGSLFGTAAFVRAISLGGGEGTMVRLSVLARNITTALAIAITSMLEGDISIAAAVTCLTGVIGGTYGKTLLSAAGVTDPVCRGLGIGSSALGLGVAAITDEPDAFPFAAISMVLTAISATTLVSIPSFKDSLVKVATGAATGAAP